MSATKRVRNRGPVADMRLVQNDSAPKYNGLNLPREIEAYKELHRPKLMNNGRRMKLAKLSLDSTDDYSRRETAQPLGEEYVDIDELIWQSINSVQLSTGDGLINTDNVISVDPSQPTVTSLGQLDSLTVGGASNFIGEVTVPPPQNDTDAATMAYAKSVVPTAGSGLSLDISTNTFAVVPSEITSVGNLSSLTVSGNASVSGVLSIPTAPVNATDAVNKLYADNIIVPGTTLVKNGNVLNVLPSGISSLPNLATIGTLANLQCNGTAVFASKVTVQPPVSNSDAASKAYVDQNTVEAGTGLTKAGNTVSIDPPGITAVGVLSSLTCSGPATFSETVEVSTPVNPGDATTKAYVDEQNTATTTTVNNALAVNEQFVTNAVTAAGFFPLQYENADSGDSLTPASGKFGFIVDGSSNLSSLVIAFPTSPMDGQLFSIYPNVTAYNVTFTNATFASSFQPSSELVAGAPVKYVYSAAMNAWL